MAGLDDVLRAVGEILGFILRGISGFLEDPFELLLEVLESLLGFVDGDVATTDKRFRVVLSHGTLGVDDLVHPWLSQRWIVCLVVAALAVTHHVDDHVFVECLPEGESQVGHASNGLGVITVDVEDRRLHHAGDIGGIHTGASVLG